MTLNLFWVRPVSIEATFREFGGSRAEGRGQRLWFQISSFRSLEFRVRNLLMLEVGRSEDGFTERKNEMAEPSLPPF